jgi:hypothetical protein
MQVLGTTIALRESYSPSDWEATEMAQYFDAEFLKTRSGYDIFLRLLRKKS